MIQLTICIQVFRLVCLFLWINHLKCIQAPDTYKCLFWQTLPLKLFSIQTSKRRACQRKHEHLLVYNAFCTIDRHKATVREWSLFSCCHFPFGPTSRQLCCINKSISLLCWKHQRWNFQQHQVRLIIRPAFAYNAIGPLATNLIKYTPYWLSMLSFLHCCYKSHS